MEEEDWGATLLRMNQRLVGRTLRWKQWWPYREGWDHDHCELCWHDICDQDEEDSDRFGWVTEDDYHWVCETCCQEFKDRFEWDLTREN